MKVQEVVNDLKRRFPNEPEYLQAVPDFYVSCHLGGRQVAIAMMVQGVL
jgi:hypothetical protein